MSKLTPLQKFLTNDLRVFREPFFEDMEAVPPEKAGYRVSSLDVFETWYISGIVGGRHPSTYSESPNLWNPYFNKVDRKGVFFSFDLPVEKDFTEFLRTLLTVSGFLDLTVTDPYKHDAFQALLHLDIPFEMSDQARHTETVNHLILDHDQQKILALNTDGLGMIWAIKEKASLRGRKVLIIGAGGSAASIGYEFIRNGNDLTISNRTPARAEALALLLTRFKNTSQQIHYGGFDQVNRFMKRTDLVVNTVAKGCPLGIEDFEWMDENTLLAETKYGGKSELKDLAMAAGLDYIDGKAMLFGQFVEAAASLFPLLSVSSDVHERVIQSMAVQRNWE